MFTLSAIALFVGMSAAIAAAIQGYARMRAYQSPGSFVPVKLARSRVPGHLAWLSLTLSIMLAQPERLLPLFLAVVGVAVFILAIVYVLSPEDQQGLFSLLATAFAAWGVSMNGAFGWVDGVDGSVYLVSLASVAFAATFYGVHFFNRNEFLCWNPRQG